MAAPAPWHGLSCRCRRCNAPMPGEHRIPRSMRVIIGLAVGCLIILVLAAAGGPSPTVIIGN